MTAAALLFHRLFGPLGTLLMTFNDIQSAGAALARLVGIAELPVPARPAETPPAAARAASVARRTYGTATRGGVEVLHDVTVDVPAGTSLAVVGESGAGKTTLAALLGGVFPATSGDIRIGGHGVDLLDPVSLRRSIGVVTQEVHVFTGTLADDLRLAVPEASDAQLWAALRTTGAAPWVEALPEGLADPGRGGGAPAQRRAGPAAGADPDRPRRPAGGDPGRGDGGGRQRGRPGAGGLGGGGPAPAAPPSWSRTGSPRPQACDQIAVMSAGRIIESGSHDDLVAAGGTYAQLWAAWHS